VAQFRVEAGGRPMPTVMAGLSLADFTGTLSAADLQKVLAEKDTEVLIECAHLEWREAGATDSLKQTISKMDPSTVTDWELLAGLGNTQGATEVYHARYQRYVDHYKQNLTNDTAALADAKAKNDQSSIATYTKQIAVDNFMLKYHGEVDAEVENDFKMGQPVQALKVLN
jgi:hypothetical protein